MKIIIYEYTLAIIYTFYSNIVYMDKIKDKKKHKLDKKNKTNTHTTPLNIISQNTIQTDDKKDDIKEKKAKKKVKTLEKTQEETRKNNLKLIKTEKKFLKTQMKLFNKNLKTLQKKNKDNLPILTKDVLNMSPLSSYSSEPFKYIIILTGYNCDQWLNRSVMSVICQTYGNYLCVLGNDGSTDRTKELMLKYVDNKQFFFFDNTVNKGAAYMRHFAIKHIEHLINPDDIIVIHGSDDYMCKNALETIHEKYIKYNSDVSYGNWTKLNGYCFNIEPFPQKIIEHKAFRRYKWLSTAIHTFKYKLYKNIDVDLDLKYNDDENNEKKEFIKNCTDLAVFYPILEQAKILTPIYDIIYIYNSRYSHNTLRRFGIKHKNKMNKIIRNKIPFYYR